MRFLVLNILFFFLINLLFSQDITPPDTPELQYVSVDPATNYVTISWIQSDSADTKGYVIYRKKINWLPIDSVYGQSIVSYIDTGSNANLYSEQYRIAAFDSSNNVSPMTNIDQYHNTIYLFPYNIRQDCVNKIKISFNSYVNWNNEVLGYIIYRDVEDSGNFIIIDTASGSSQAYYDTSIVNDDYYCYYIEAYNSDELRSTSNKTCIIADLPESIKFLNADFATISDYNLISLSFTTDNAYETINSFKLLESDQIDGLYSAIQTYDAPFSSKITYSQAIDMKNEQKYYKLAAYNECDQIEKESNIAGNILLNISHPDTLKHELTWNGYTEWIDNVSQYNVYKVDENNTPELIETVYSPNTTIDVTSLSFEKIYDEYVIYKVSGNFCYFIEAIEGSNNPYGVQGKSRSNLACISENPYVHIPNAFSPDNNGYNDVFRPFVLFASSENYSFYIYNRWGEIIFKTSDPSQGWNGKIKGRNAKEGTYSYFLSFQTAENKIYEKRGTFSLIYP
ncbi:MAG: gliding motility-associated C-terminal domain-containing protein [Bacteroidota bacterium]